MNTTDTILTRRSVRSFEERDVPEEVLNQLLEACRWAPSWANTQCWEIVVIRDPDVRKGIEQAVPEGNPAVRCIVSAPVLLGLCARRNVSGFYRGQASTKFGDWFMFDLGIAAQNIALSAHALGLGSVVLGLFDQDKARTFLELPEDCDLVALMPLGYPAEEPRTPKRRALSEFTHYDRWGRKGTT